MAVVEVKTKPVFGVLNEIRGLRAPAPEITGSLELAGMLITSQEVARKTELIILQLPQIELARQDGLPIRYGFDTFA